MEHPKIRYVLQKSKTRINEKIKKISDRYGYLPYMISRYVEMLGLSEALELLKANEIPLPEYFRCNDYLIDCQTLQRRLEKKGIITTHIPTYSPYAYRIDRTPISPGAVHEHLLGYYFLQGPASMSIVHALEPKAGDIILDMAAAPGGKSTQILQMTRDASILVAVEKNRRRVKSLRANLQRLRFKNYIILRRDSTQLNFNNIFDKILLDAPSTGEGIIRKDPTRKRSRTPADLIHIHKIQTRMLASAIKYAKPGASIVYSACTLAPEEGELVIDSILRKFNNIDILPLNLKNISPGTTNYFGVTLDERVKLCGRFWPHIHNTEGFFVCKLVKRR